MASCSPSSFSRTTSPLSLSKITKISPPSLSSRRPRSPIASLSIELKDIIEIAHNKVLVAATVSATIGQLSKPFASAIRGDGFNLKSVIQSGGMPSTHSASVVAAATSLGLERGFSDSIFGMSAVFAALVMYDAQGVRREVGTHAKILNRIVKAQDKKKRYLEQEAPADSKPDTSSSVNSAEIVPLISLSEKTNAYTSSTDSYSIRGSRTTSSNLGSMPSLKNEAEEKSQEMISYGLLNESVGHTEIQVIVGAVLGFVVSVAINTIL